jgi:hypothetical protein
MGIYGATTAMAAEKNIPQLLKRAVGNVSEETDGYYASFSDPYQAYDALSKMVTESIEDTEERKVIFGRALASLQELINRIERGEEVAEEYNLWVAKEAEYLTVREADVLTGPREISSTELSAPMLSTGPSLVTTTGTLDVADVADVVDVTDTTTATDVSDVLTDVPETPDEPAPEPAPEPEPILEPEPVPEPEPIDPNTIIVPEHWQSGQPTFPFPGKGVVAKQGHGWATITGHVVPIHDAHWNKPGIHSGTPEVSGPGKSASAPGHGGTPPGLGGDHPGKGRGPKK